MKPISVEDVKDYVRNNIGTFHSNRLQSLRKLKLIDVLRRKNPYLFKAKNLMLAQDLVKMVLDAHLSSQEEAIFGNFLEGLAVFVNGKVYGGWKSSAQGIDLEFDKNGVRYVVAVKSGPSWGNSSQIRKMMDDFTKAQKTLRSSNPKMQVVAVNGCCYGRGKNPDKGSYYKYCGQVFWKFISDNDELYLKLVKPLGYTAKQKNVEFSKEYAKIVNIFTIEFSNDFVTGGQIDWEALVRFNSSS